LIISEALNIISKWLLQQTQNNVILRIDFMLEEFYYPEQILPEELDHLLAQGWYRMGQSLFTTDYVLFDERIYPAIWLRNDLNQYREGKTIQKLRKRNQAFQIRFQKARITPEHEWLYRQYQKGIPFLVSSSVHQLLLGYGLGEQDLFNTYEISIIHNNHLIASSYFDIGANSAEGISAFYHPAYRTCSLGKYMIYLQIQVCHGNGLRWYYPGYFVPGYKHLDYKLDIGTECLSYFDKKDLQWHNIEKYNGQGVSLDMRNFMQQYFPQFPQEGL
jgi:arginyl-tRNA--protein-N-Asp/Glu arginylyltransferase